MLAAVAVHRVYDLLARNDVVERCAKRVNVRPRTLLAACAVLLRRRKARLEQNRHSLVLTAYVASRRAEVDQLDSAVICNDNILGTEVAVEDFLSVDLHQRAGNGDEHLLSVVRLHLASVFARVLSQIAAVEVFHNKIGGIILRKIIDNINDYRVILQLIKRFGFFNELFSAVGKDILGFFICQRIDTVRARIALRILGRHIFLDRAECIFVNILCDVGYAETASAEHLADHVAVIQN